MFVNLPQKLTAPFGLLGDDAKLAFPMHPGGIAKLASVRNIPDNDTYWEQYFTLFDSASDIFALITPHHIRKALLDAPENIATLIRVVSTRLFNLITDHTFPSSTGSMTAFASSLIKAGTGMSERNTTKEVLNCLRILQRVLPVLFELDAEISSLEEDVMWKKEELDSAPDTTEEPQFVIEDEDEDTGAGARLGQTQDSQARKQLPSLAERLFDSLFDLLFCCGFTLPSKIQIDHHKIQHVIWEKGVGSTMDIGLNSTYDTNKIEVLRLLLVLLSRQIYVSPNCLFSKPSPYTLYLVQKVPRRKVLALLCSLLNTAMNSSLTNDKSFGSMAGRLPYNHLVFKGEDHRTTLVGLCLQILCILLDFQSGSSRDKEVDGSDPCSLPTARTNAYRYFIMKLHRTQDFEFIYQGILSILYHQIASTSNLLPGARKPVPHVPEIVVLLWKMLELNKRFFNHILGSDKAMNLPVYLLCYGLDIRDKPQQHGLCRAISYIMQTLSAESAFGTKLSLPLRVQTPVKWSSAGTTADFLVNAIHAMVTTSSGGVNSLYPALVITLSNSAPYFKNLSMTASSKLVQLFNSFSNPLFLLSDEGHPRLVFFMLEVFNSIIFHHPSDNSNLLYCILSSPKIFEDLGTFTLAKGLGEISRVQVAREDLATRLESHATISGEKEISTDNEGIGSVATPTRQIDMTLPPQSETHDDQEGTLPRIATSSVSMNSGNNLKLATSEKVKGKMKERRSSSLDPNSSSERLAGTRIGRNGFTPTQEWVASWQERLPLDVVMLVISELLPKVQQLQASQKANLASTIKDLLSINDLRHVLPPAPTSSPRRFMWSDASIIWLTSLIWGEIYVRAMTPLGIWNGTNVRLFYVKHTQFQQRQIADTVSQVVGGLLRRNSDVPQTWLTDMISADLSSLSTLSIQQKTTLERGGIHSIAKLLLTPTREVAWKCQLSPIEVRVIIDTVCKECINLSIPCLADIAEDGNELFTTGDKDIDSALGGGIRTGMIWEVVGESAAGKTQFALQLSLFVQIAPELGGLEGSCCYLTTSAKLPTERLLQISDSHENLTSTECALSHIHTITVPSATALLHVLSRTLPEFIEQQARRNGARPVKLIVIDTLAELFHDIQKTTTATLVERSRHIAGIGSLLHTLAAERRIAIVVLNEVVDAFNRGRLGSEDNTELGYNNLSQWFARGNSVTGEDRKEASLGLVWANQVNARILLSRTGRRRHLTHGDVSRIKARKNDGVGDQASGVSMLDTAQGDQSTLVRRLNVIFSSVCPSVSLDYIITRSGISALPDSTFYPSLSAEPSTLSVDEARQDNILTTHHTTSLDIDVTDNIGIGSAAPESESENEWDKLWDNDEISAEAYFSFADTS